MKIKCVKAECPICKVTGSIQLFLNKQNQVRYARTRHYSHVDKDSKKPQFTYCKIENLDPLEELLRKLGFSLPTANGQVVTIGQATTQEPSIETSNLMPNTQFFSKNIKNAVPLGFEPRTFSLEGSKNIDLKEYRDFLASQYTKQYTSLLYGYTLKHSAILNNPQKLSELPASIKGNVLKAIVALSKFLGCYEDFKLNLKQHGIHWTSNDNSFNSFLRIINNNHSNIGAWYKEAQNILRDNEKLWLRFNLLTGLRKEESINSFNLIIKLANENKLSEYYSELGILEHFKHGELFLRHTKNCYISIVPKELIQQITKSSEVSYSAIRKRLTRKRQPLRIKELRSYYATYLRNHGILAEYVDLIQGRIPKSVFARHYLKVEDLKVIVKQVLAVTANMEIGFLT